MGRVPSNAGPPLSPGEAILALIIIALLVVIWIYASPSGLPMALLLGAWFMFMIVVGTRRKRE